MSHHSRKIKIDSYGTERRVRRDRKSSRPKLTKGDAIKQYYNPDPDGKPPGTWWALTNYPMERKRRIKLSKSKRKNRRLQLRREARDSLKLEE
jgi:hypothetical protein